VEYPRDVWRLRNLGIHHRRATISFKKIPQPWLKDLAKRWARWQLTTGLGPGSVGDGTRALARFGAFLAAGPAPAGGLADVDRPLLERYLADLHAAMAGRACHGYHVGALGAFLRAVRRHHFDDTLPPDAMLFPEDYPKPGKRLPRALAEHIMAQVEQPASLDRWDNPAYQLITLILIRCGLRITDAARVSFDCIVCDADGAPYCATTTTR
jgi:integrase